MIELLLEVKQRELILSTVSNQIYHVWNINSGTLKKLGRQKTRVGKVTLRQIEKQKKWWLNSVIIDVDQEHSVDS